MVQKAVKSYTALFDEKIENPTLIVLIIGWLIVLVGVFIPNAHANTGYMKSSVLEYSHSIETENTILINGEEYIIYISKK